MKLDNKELISVYYIKNGDDTYEKTAKICFSGFKKDGFYIEPRTYGRKWIVNSDEISDFYDSEIDAFFKEVERNYNNDIELPSKPTTITIKTNEDT